MRKVELGYMKAGKVGWLTAVIGCGISCLFCAAGSNSTQNSDLAQLLSMLPPDLQSIGTGPAPGTATTWYSLQQWPDAPPMPMNWLEAQGVEIYYSPSRNSLFLNDLGINYTQPGTLSEGIPDPGDGGGDPGDGGGDPGTGATPIPPWTVTPGLYLVPPVAQDASTLWLCVTNTDTNAVPASYDLFCSTALEYTNGWRWLARSQPDQTSFLLSNLPPQNAFFILGLTNDSDGDGMSDAVERLVTGSDPQTADSTSIGFTLSFAREYYSTNIIAGALCVTSGYPTLMAVLVNDTNLDTAVWVPLTTNFAVNLGTEDGPKTVRVGLSGPTPDIGPAWQSEQVTLEQTPPELHITSPATLTSSQPMIQLQGYSPEPLSSIYFDIANDAGQLTNQQGFVKSQDLDPVSFKFTTNHFQCYDCATDSEPEQHQWLPIHHAGIGSPLWRVLGREPALGPWDQCPEFERHECRWTFEHNQSYVGQKRCGLHDESGARGATPPADG